MNMKKIKILLQVFFSALVCCMLCACQANSTKNTVQEQDGLSEHKINIQAYLPVIANIDIEDAAFSLIFLDSDTIPGLVVLDRYLDQYSEPLTDDFVPSFEFTYNAVYDINGEWTGEGITEYYKKGERIDETAYNQIFVDFNISQNDAVSCSSENVQHFTRDEILEYLSTEMAEEN